MSAADKNSWAHAIANLQDLLEFGGQGPTEDQLRAEDSHLKQQILQVLQCFNPFGVFLQETEAWPLAPDHAERLASLLLSLKKGLKKGLEKPLKQIPDGAQTDETPLHHYCLLLANRLAQLLGQDEEARGYLEPLMAQGLAFNREYLLGSLPMDEFHRSLLLAIATTPAPLQTPEVPPQFQGYQKLIQFNHQLSHHADLTLFLKGVLDTIIDTTGALRGFLMLDGPERSGEFSVRVARNFSHEDLENPLFQVSQSICNRVIRSGRCVVVHNALTDRKWQAIDSIADLQLCSILCLPFKIRDRIVGTLYVDHPEKEQAFDDIDLEFLKILSDQAAIAIEHSRLEEENKHKLLEVEEKNREILVLNRRLEDELAHRTRELEELQLEVSQFKKDMALKFSYDTLVGGVSHKMRELFKVLDLITASESTVHVFGESGTGKELVARAIHFNGPRRDGPFVSINCGAIPDSLLESELFGHERGAFTSADRKQRGLFEQASGGTLFLDEVGDMSAEMQVKLLRVLEENSIRPVGSNTSIEVDVRVISAANKSLQQGVAEGEFRQDLFFRLNVILLTLPPLRERIEDLELLVPHILNEMAQGKNHPAKRLTRAALNHLERYSWPGNVRELKNVLERCVIFTKNEEIDFMDLPPEIILNPRFDTKMKPQSEYGALLGMPFDEALVLFEKNQIEIALKHCQGNVLNSSKYLNMQRSTLRRKIEEFKIDPKQFKL